MTVGNKTFKNVEHERVADVLLDAANRTNKASKVIFVDSSSGSASNSGERMSSPMATISQALEKCTAGKGDTIVILPDHAETRTAVITVNKSNVTIKSMARGNKRAVITVNGAVDLFSLEAAGCSIEDLDLTIVTTDAATALINVAAAKCAIKNVKMIPSATSVNVEDCITLASGADDVLIENTEIFNTTVAVNSFLSIEAAVARPVIRFNRWFGDVATAGVIDGAAATQIMFYGNRIGVVGTTKPAVTLDSNPTGMVFDNYFAGTHGTLATNANLGNAVRAFQNFLLEETNNSAQGVLSPVADSD